jgi:hypothetical protein
MDKAIVSGTYSDFKIIRSRKVAQLVVEVPIEQAQSLIHALGLPNPAQETWVAVARLQTPAKEETPPAAVPEPHRPFASLPYPQQAALRCQDLSFRAFIRSSLTADWVKDEEDAAEFVRGWCNISTRKDIKPDTEAEKLWLKLNSQYEFWASRRDAA